MFECCYKCKPPKRHPGSQDRCPEKKAADEKYAERKSAEAAARHRCTSTVYAQRSDSIYRAYKRRKGRK